MNEDLPNKQTPRYTDGNQRNDGRKGINLIYKLIEVCTTSKLLSNFGDVYCEEPTIPPSLKVNKEVMKITIQPKHENQSILKKIVDGNYRFSLSENFQCMLMKSILLCRYLAKDFT